MCILSYSMTVDMTGCDIGVCVCVCVCDSGVFTSVWGVWGHKGAFPHPPLIGEFKKRGGGEEGGNCSMPLQNLPLIMAKNAVLIQFQKYPYRGRGTAPSHTLPRSGTLLLHFAPPPH